MLVDPYVLPRRLFTNKALSPTQVAMRIRHWIGTLSPPRMATAQTAQSQPCAAKKTVSLERFEKVNRTSGLKTASGARTAQKREHGRNEQLITANQKTQEQDHQGARIEARSARRNHSSFRSL
jgi:hypothetical protein